MVLEDYKRAEQFLNRRRSEIRRMRKLDDRVQEYYNQSTKITPGYGTERTTGGKIDSRVAFAVEKMIDTEILKTEVAAHFLQECRVFDEISDSIGAKVVFFYYLLEFHMGDVSEELQVSVRSCWRHLRVALAELESFLERA